MIRVHSAPRLLILAVTLAGSGGSLHGQIPCEYLIAAVIQAPPCPFTGPPVTIAAGISPNGRYVVGSHHQCDPIYDEAFVYDTQTTEFFSLPRPPGVYDSSAGDVNDAGLAVGSYWKSGFGLRGFIYDYPKRQYVAELEPLPGGAWCGISAINASGTVCGTRSIGNGVQPRNAYLWSANDGFTDLGVMNGPNSYSTHVSDSGRVVGWTGSDSGISNDNARAFIHEAGVTTVLGPVPKGLNSMGEVSNSEGEIILRGRLQTGERLLAGSFLYRKGSIIPLAVPSGFDRTFGLDMNDDGLIAGSVSHSSQSQVFHPTIWTSTCVTLVNDLVVEPSSITLGTAVAVSGVGTVVTFGLENGDHIGVILSPVWRTPGDTNCDRTVNVSDLLQLINDWGSCACCSTDLTQDGLVDRFDLMALIENWASPNLGRGMKGGATNKTQ